MKRLGLYVACVSNIAKVMLAYRGAFLLGGLGSIVSMLVLVFFWRAVYAGVPTVGGMDLGEMITYVVVAQFTTNLVGYFFVEGTISSKIREGTIAVELVQPFDYQTKQFAETIGFVTVRGAIHGALILAVGFLFLGVRPPASPAAALLFVPSVLLAVAVEASLGFCVGMTAFYTTNIFGVVTTRRMVCDLLSGAVVPLHLFPPPLYAAARLLPFSALVYVPTSIWLGRIAGAEALAAIGLQAFWAAAAWAAGALVWRRVVRRLEVHGG